TFTAFSFAKFVVYLVLMFKSILSKIYLLTIFMLFSATSAESQILDPVSWSFEVENLGNGECNLIFKAKIEEHWHLYTQDVPELGPVPTQFVFEKNASLNYIDGVKES